MTADYPTHSNPRADSPAHAASERWLFWLVWAALIAALFFNLGDAALFEPDEGRNAEKAREILLLDDWVTPHDNFHPVLDKPILSYWLIAASFKLFGLSEWAARLPSALAAFACLVLVYRFALTRWGRWEAYWSVVILLTGIEFFVLARTVILDMPLTCLLTLALWAFYEAAHSETVGQRRSWCLALYAALGLATLIKGLIGVILPGLVIFFYLLLTRRWALLKRVYLVPGALLFLVIVLPWYLSVEARNDGYLRYYLWDEHFGRFTGADFNRSEPWPYFILVALVGFYPWTLLLPVVVWEAWKSRADDKTLYLGLWVVLPLVFFSASGSKLPHYILPIFPPLAILTANLLVRRYRTAPIRLQSALSLSWWIQSVAALYLALGTLFPMILLPHIRDSIDSRAAIVWIYAALSIALLVYLRAGRTAVDRSGPLRLYLIQGLGLAVFLIFVVDIAIAISPSRSARVLADKALPHRTPTTQLVFYDTFLSGLAFYLRTDRPIWYVTNSAKKRTFLGNFYTFNKLPDPLTPWGQAKFDFDRFRDRVKSFDGSLLIILKPKNLANLQENIKAPLHQLARVDDYVVVSTP